MFEYKITDYRTREFFRFAEKIQDDIEWRYAVAGWKGRPKDHFVRCLVCLQVRTSVLRLHWFHKYIVGKKQQIDLSSVFFYLDLSFEQGKLNINFNLIFQSPW